VIRPPRPEDAAALAALLEAMEAEYGIPLPPGRAEAAARLILAGAPHAHCRLAFQDGAAVGIALFAKLFPGAALTDIVYLKDLYVAPAGRRHGVARALLRAVATFAVEQQATRIEWSTGRDNLPARRLYAAIGAPTADKVVLRVDGTEAIRRMAEGSLDPIPETRD
jgi:GNAT superfamily N-acetyltransferase